MIAVRIGKGVTDHLPFRLSEWGMAVNVLGIGVLFLTKTQAYSNPGFVVFAGWASEQTWGIILTVIGGLRLIALIVNGTFNNVAPWSVRVRALTSFFSVFAWFCLCAGTFLSGNGQTGALTYGTHMALDIFLASFLAGHAGDIDRKIRNGGL